mgnify:CR=1 FL=1
MVNRISAPYNFVPLNECVYIPEWENEVNQDIPFDDGEDGIIEVRWKNVSPLCVRDSSCDKEKGFSMHIVMPDGKRLYFIPGSSLRGMLRNIVSIMSFGRMTQYGNKFFGHRKFDTKKTDAKEYRKNMLQVKYGWLEAYYGGYKLWKCKGNADKISIDDVKAKAKDENYVAKKSAWDRNEAIAGNTFPVYEKNGVSYRIFATGKMDKKKNELLIPTDVDENPVLFDAKDDAIISFFTVYNNTDGFENYIKMLKNGKRIPVSYICKGCKYIFGMGKMLRYPYDYSIKDLVDRVQKTKVNAGHDLADTIFGWVDGDDSMKGRVQVCNAFSLQPLEDTELCAEVKGVLASPKPSYYPLYIQQGSAPCKTYSSEDAKISGRKLYRIHEGSSTTRLPQGNDNENTMTRFRPVPSGQTFVMRVVVHNMRKIEIGALLAAITLNNTPGTWHNIGSAKGYGYGKLEFDGLSLQGLRFTEEEYLKAFEYEMSLFTKHNYSCLWRETEQINRLVAILSEHDNDDVRMMEMDNGKSPLGENEYEYYKTNDKFSVLIEPNKRIKTYLNEAQMRRDSFRKEKSDIYEAIKDAEEKGEFRQAITLLNGLINDMLIRGLEKVEEEERVSRLAQKQEEKDKQQQQMQEDAEKAKKTQLISDGFEAFINQKDSNNANYKVNKWNTCASLIEKWLKVNGTSELVPKEKDIVECVIRRLYANPDKSEKRNWKEDIKKGKIWRSMKSYLGEERTVSLYKELKK